MDILIEFYKRTWWVWLLCVIGCVVLAYFLPDIRILFVVLIPGILAWSLYFGFVRGPEMFDKK